LTSPFPRCAHLSSQADGLIYFGGSDRKFNALNVESLEIVNDLEGHHDLVRTLVIKPELERLVSGSYDQDVRVSSICYVVRRSLTFVVDLGSEDGYLRWRAD
jgi:WD40 repeat protein